MLARSVVAMTTWQRGFFASAGAVVLIASVSVSAPALAAPSKGDAKAKQSQIGKQLSQLKSQVNEMSSQEAELVARLDEINNRKAEIEARTAGLQTEMDKAQADMDAAQVRLDQLHEREEQARIAQDKAEAALAVSTEVMHHQAVDAYVGDEPNSDLTTFLLKTDDVRQVAAASEYLHQIVQDRRQIVEQHRELQGQARDLAKQVDDALAEAQVATDVIVSRQDQLADQKAELDAVHSQAAADADAEVALLTEIEAKKVDLAAEMALLQQQSDSIAATLRSVGTGGAAPPAGKGVLALPVPGAPLTSVFGMRVNPVTGVLQLHGGQDFGAPSNTPVRASAAGAVVVSLPAASSGGYGNYVCISHSGGMATCYAHLNRALVTVGQVVARNDVIGLVGSTGRSTGPHLHYEVRINGQPVNPLLYL